MPAAASFASAPEFQSPTPTGPYSVGTRYFYLTDENRADTYTPNPADHRKISLQIWYPASPESDAAPMNFGNREAAEYFTAQGVMDSLFVKKVTLSPSHSFLKAAIAKGKEAYPVVLFSASGVMDANTLLSEELASHGYVVVCVGHPYWCEYYFGPDGEVIFFDKENQYYKRMWEEENSEIVQQTKDRITRAQSADEKQILAGTLNSNMPTEIHDLRLWAGDIGFVIDELRKINAPDSLFHHRLDLDKIGVIGYSKGGVAAAQACLTDPRCKAGVNLGGFMFGDILEQKLTVPFMNMEHVEPWCQECLPINELLFHNSKSNIYMVQIHGATHANFTDLTATRQYLPENIQGILGSMDGNRFLTIMEDYVVQFFNRSLKSLPAPLLDGQPPAYPEVVFKSHHP